MIDNEQRVSVAGSEEIVIPSKKDWRFCLGYAQRLRGETDCLFGTEDGKGVLPFVLGLAVSIAGGSIIRYGQEQNQYQYMIFGGVLVVAGIGIALLGTRRSYS